LYCISSHSEDLDTIDAVTEIITDSQAKLDGRVPSAGLLMASIDADHQLLLDRLMETWPKLELIGCTTDGEISSELGFCEDSIALVLFCDVEIHAGIGLGLSKSNQQACQDAAEMARAKCGSAPSLCITTPESLTSNGELTVKNLQAALGEGVPLFGGIAADQWRFKATYQFYGNQLFQDAVPLLLFSGDLAFSYGVASGWKPIGEAAVVTKAEGNLVYQIDQMTAMDYYRRYLGSAAVPTGGFPLAILGPEGNIEYLRSSMENYDLEQGSITYYGDVPQGSKVQITVADRNAIIEGCSQSLDLALERFPEGAQLQVAICVSCAARKLLLGTKTEEESKLIAQKLGPQLPMIGFYSYGEVAPSLLDEDRAQFHNETFVTLLLGSKSNSTH